MTGRRSRCLQSASVLSTSPVGIRRSRSTSADRVQSFGLDADRQLIHGVVVDAADDGPGIILEPSEVQAAPEDPVLLDVELVAFALLVARAEFGVELIRQVDVAKPDTPHHGGL